MRLYDSPLLCCVCPPLFTTMSPHDLWFPLHSLTLPPLMCSDFCHISLHHCNTFHFFSFSCLALAKEETFCVDAGSELQAYQLGQPLCLSRDEEQVLEELSISGPLMLLSNVVTAGQATKGVMAKQSDCRSLISPEKQTEIILYFHTCTEWSRRNPSNVILFPVDQALLPTRNGRFHLALATRPRPARTQRQDDALPHCKH